ncbi:ABC transporter permease subunit [Akkermansia glycaniphila]|uniref:ABC transporter permease n=1 Tax=Akkermansia glycaniphila TaxID=1679444 RepID=UPI001C026C58|nr:ABC transporter permease subunit [Akkermansia glycaniphila]MBT9448620.1 ABC transporter permease subunit [Akkermansia glycaniphila]
MPALLNRLLAAPSRIGALASVTFVQLVRMKVFVFLAVFALALILLQSLRINDVLGPETYGRNELALLKNTAVGGMRLFGLLFAVAATSLLLPKDTEDRIIYTILCKPVPRFDYLLGKALGVLSVLGVALLCMDALLSVILEIRTSTVLTEQSAVMHAAGLTEAQMQPYLEGIRQAGLTWDLQASLLVMFMEWAVLTSLTLFFSCFTSSTLTSMIFAFGFYIVGSFQSQFFGFALHGQDGVSQTVQNATDFFGAIVPNFQIYAISDAGINGRPISPGLIGSLTLITCAYFLFHLCMATWIFRRKEF